MVFQYVAAFKRDMSEILNEETKIGADVVQDAYSQKKKAYARTMLILLRVWQPAAELNNNTPHIPDATFQGHAGSASVLDRVYPWIGR